MLDLVIRGGNVVFPGRGVATADIGVADGKTVLIGRNLPQDAAAVVDASGKTVLPGIVDSHFHLGIFRPLGEDARTESGSALAGGVTSTLIYFRAGRNNLFTDVTPDLPPTYRQLYPSILEQARGNFWCDYGFSLAPVTQAHVDEIDELVLRSGVTTFKYYMHYRGIAPGTEPMGNEKEYVYSDTRYDLGHLHAAMAQIAKVNSNGHRARLSIHAEHPAIIRENTESTRRLLSELNLNPLELYSLTRPPSGERLGILIAAELASQTGCPINILHISSGEALNAIREARQRYPGIDIVAEATVHHLSLANDEYGLVNAKVNPPIRRSSDREILWDGIRAGDVQTIVSDHAAISKDRKGEDVWQAWYGFGGTELLVPAVITEGHVRRGIPLEKLAGLLSASPARVHGLGRSKGDIAIGYDADFAIIDIGATRTVDHTQLHSAQDFSPFDGQELTGWVDTTILRGTIAYQGGELKDEPRGVYLSRPM